MRTLYEKQTLLRAARLVLSDASEAAPLKPLSSLRFLAGVKDSGSEAEPNHLSAGVSASEAVWLVGRVWP